MARNKLVNAIASSASQNTAQTYNGAKTFKSSLSALVDLFFIAGASRGNDLTAQFAKAFAEDEYLALRLVQWLRDAREGAGERQQFRNLFGWLIRNHKDAALAVLTKVPELGRWDDILIGLRSPIENEVVELVREGIAQKNGLLAKWLPRKGEDAVRLRHLLGYTPKQYRKTIVNLSNTVEQAMCAGKWDEIKYNQVPSVAFARYKRAFSKRAPEKFQTFVTKVQAGEAKINASAVFPYDIIRSLRASYNKVEQDAANEQWKALPNWLEGSDERLIVVADTSGSMTNWGYGTNRGNIGNVTPMDICISLALYVSEKLNGPFKDAFITFSNTPTLQVVKGTLRDRVSQLETAKWEMNTNLQAAFELILNTAKKHGLSNEDLPTKVLVISDMEFDSCAANRSTNFENIEAKYKAAGYAMPQLVFWNVNGRVGNSPVTQHQSGAALISGFSPSIAKSILGAQLMTPESVMLKTLMNPRYDL
jgi:hypothetical protein